MKKHIKNEEPDARLKEVGEPEVDGEAGGEVAGVNSIQEFIELKKLQNRILGKMLEKMNKPEDQSKSNNK